MIEIDPIKFLKSDGRHLQILFLSSFLFYGIEFLQWEIGVEKLVSIFATCVLTQCIAAYFFNKPYSSIKSALITALGLTLLFKTNDWYIYVLAAFLSISSKFIFKTDKKHFFNPANFGIIATILLTQNAWISPGQWGNGMILVFLIGSLGLTVVMKVGKLDSILGFLIIYLGLEFYRNILFKGWPFDFFIHQMMSGSLLLFTFFMITDPVSTPSSKLARYIWSGLVGLLAFLLSNYWFISVAPVWALCMMSPLTPLFDRLFPADRFSWEIKNNIQTNFSI